MLGGAILVIVAVLFFGVRACVGSGKGASDKEQKTAQDNSQGNDPSSPEDDGETNDGNKEEDMNPLEKGDADITAFMQSYYKALGERDIATLKTLVSDLTSADESRKQWKPNLGVVIRKNVLDGVPGDGIVLAGCDGGLIEYNVMKNCPKTLPESEACDGIWPWCSDNTVVQFNVVSDHKSIIDGYAYDSDWGCRNSVFQYNLSYNNDGGFMLVIGTDGWPEDWCVNGNIETKVRYNVSINDGLRNYLTNASHKDAYFSPAMHFTGYTQNTLVENNLFYLFPKPEPQIDRTLFHFTKHDSSYGKGDVFKNNYIYAPEVTVAVKEEKAVGNQYSGNVYVGSLKTPATGFTKQDGFFNKSLWYNAEDKNWDILLDFLKDKTVPVNGKELKVLDIIGAN